MPRQKTKRRAAAASRITAENYIKDALKGDKMVVGSRIVFKSLKKGALNKVVYASNCPDNKKADLEKIAKASGIEAEGFNGDSEKLGEICSKPFGILVIGIKK